LLGTHFLCLPLTLTPSAAPWSLAAVAVSCYQRNFKAHLDKKIKKIGNEEAGREKRNVSRLWTWAIHTAPSAVSAAC